MSIQGSVRVTLRFWLIKVGEQLPVNGEARKLRTGILAAELAARGHEVIWWTSAFNHFKKEWTFDEDTSISADGVRIRAERGLGYSKNVSLRRFADHRVLARKFGAWAASNPRPDAIVVAYPPHDLADEVVAFAKRASVPVILDVRDKWPDIFVDVLPARVRPAGRLALATEFRRRDRAFRDADVLVSMTRPLLTWAQNCGGGVPSMLDQVFYLGAYRDATATVPAAAESVVRDLSQRRMVVTFMGQFEKYSNPSIAIEAARQLQDLTDLTVVLAGDGSLAPKLHESAHGLSNVVFTGWLDSPAMTAVLRASHLGLVTSGRGNDDEFLPNKVFNYLSEGVPIASVFGGELRELIDEYGIGFNYSSTTELVAGIRDLYRDPERLGDMSAQARRFYAENGNARVIYAAYADLVESVAAGEALR